MRKFEDLSSKTKDMYTKAYNLIPCDKSDFGDVLEYAETLSVHQQKTLFKALVHFDEVNKEMYSKKLLDFANADRERSSIKFYSENEQKLLEYYRLVMAESTDTSKYTNIYSRMVNGTLEKVLICLHLNHPLRSDYYTIKIRNYNIKSDNYYSNGVIHFNEMVKVNRSFSIKLSEDSTEVVNSYIRGLPENESSLFPWKNSNSYTQAVRRISSEVFGEPFSINKYRHLKDFPNAIKDIYSELNERALSMNHTLATHVSNY